MNRDIDASAEQSRTSGLLLRLSGFFARYNGGHVLLVGAVAVQIVSASFFVYEVFGPVLGVRRQPLNWVAHEMIEIGAALGLVLGLCFGAGALAHNHAKRREAEGKLVALSGAFNDLLEQRFREWALTPAENDVAHFVMKGCSTQEIASFRETSEGTVKAQTAAIYRKAGVTGRVQLVSLFLDDLMNGDVAGRVP